MKKILLILGLLILNQSIVQAEVQPSQAVNNNNNQLKIMQYKPHKDHPIEIKLGLSEEQKMRARQIRYKGHEDLYPVIEQIKAKRQEAQMIKNSRIAVQVQEERLAKIDKELNSLEKQARKIRTQNMKEFESILTKAQKKALKQMKEEGRKKYREQHPHKNIMQQPERK